MALDYRVWTKDSQQPSAGMVCSIWFTLDFIIVLRITSQRMRFVVKKNGFSIDLSFSPNRIMFGSRVKVKSVLIKNMPWLTLAHVKLSRMKARTGFDSIETPKVSHASKYQQWGKVNFLECLTYWFIHVQSLRVMIKSQLFQINLRCPNIWWATNR